jgi:hypothetical protein
MDRGGSTKQSQIQRRCAPPGPGLGALRPVGQLVLRQLQDISNVLSLRSARRRLVGELAMPRNVSDLVLLACMAAFLSGVVITAAKLLIG